MKKIVFVCGLIAGLISIGWAVVSIAITTGTGKNMDMETGMIYGYAAMVLGFSLIFVGIKNYRDKHNGGMITFGKAFKIGLYITLVASTVYVAVWLIDYFFFLPEDFLDQHYTKGVLEKLKASGASQAIVDQKTTEMANFSKLYRNPFFNALITYAEILPVGLLVSLIAALILKRKNRPSEFQTVNA